MSWLLRMEGKTLSEIFGTDATRGDGRKFTNFYWQRTEPNQWFEPIYKTNKGIWFGLTNLGCSYESAGNVSEWIEWIAPRRKVKLYKWAYKSAMGEWFETKRFCAEYTHELSVKVVRLDHTMIEVDDEENK